MPRAVLNLQSENGDGLLFVKGVAIGDAERNEWIGYFRPQRLGDRGGVEQAPLANCSRRSHQNDDFSATDRVIFR